MMIVHAEQNLGLFREHAVQSAFLGSDSVIDAFNAYYGGTHFLIPIAVLVFLFIRHPAHYTRARTALAAITALAFVVFWLFPVAPPRMLPAHYGIVDTLIAHGSGHIEASILNSAGDQFASMPSLHVAWAVWCTLAVYPVVRNWWIRGLAILYPLMTTLVVVATGNHFFLDVIAGAVLAIGTWIVVTRAGAWLTVRTATWRARRGYYAGRPADLYSLLPADGHAIVGWMSPSDQSPADAAPPGNRPGSPADGTARPALPRPRGHAESVGQPGEGRRPGPDGPDSDKTVP
jgi:membrane-associated phospholipid phosphatase